MPSCPDPTISTRNLGLFADLQVTEVTNKITPRYCGEAKSQSPKVPRAHLHLSVSHPHHSPVPSLSTLEHLKMEILQGANQCKSVQKEEKTSLAWWLPRTWGTTVHVAGRSMKIQAAMCQLSQSRAPSGPIGPHRLKKSSLCRFLCNDSFVTSLYAGPFARYPTLSRSNCGEGMVKSPSVSSAPQNEHMTKQHKPDVGSEDSQPLNAKSLQCCATTSHSHAKSLQRTK